MRVTTRRIKIEMLNFKISGEISIYPMENREVKEKSIRINPSVTIISVTKQFTLHLYFTIV